MRRCRLLAAILLLVSCGLPAHAGPVRFTAVAAGDPSTDGALLWTRVRDEGAAAAAVDLQLEIGNRPGFTQAVQRLELRSDPARDGVARVEVSGLAPGATWYYRFVAPGGETSPAGRFRTAPPAHQAAAVSLAFSGDADGRWRPYPLVHDFGASHSGGGLDFFVFIGDTIYETASAGSPAAADPFADPVRALADYRRKYRENLEPVHPGGQAGLAPLYAAQGQYTLPDNHELGNRQFQSGGAPAGEPPGRGVDPADARNDANTSGTCINHSPGFRALMQAYRDYLPVRERRLEAAEVRADDPCAAGTDRLYLAQSWGRNLLYVQVDDRSYRDIRLRTAFGDDTGARADHPRRTLLGATQFAWLCRTLQAAQAAGVVWKVIALSSPIDRQGLPGGALAPDGGKSWYGGYRAEREALLRFIAGAGIDNVLFISTDDHHNRVNEVGYAPDPAHPLDQVPVPGALTIVAGPLGAAGPDLAGAHDAAGIESVADAIAIGQRHQGVDPLGLDPAWPGLRRVWRAGDAQADARRAPADFYSPDTFNYVRLDIDADATLHVSTWGIPAYPANSRPEAQATGEAQPVLGFDLLPRGLRTAAP